MARESLDGERGGRLEHEPVGEVDPLEDVRDALRRLYRWQDA